MRKVAWSFTRVVVVVISLFCAGALGLAGLVGGLSGDHPTARNVTHALAAGALAGALLAAFVRGPLASVALAAVTAGGVAFALSQNALDRAWWIWVLLALAAGLAWSLRK